VHVVAGCKVVNCTKHADGLDNYPALCLASSLFMEGEEQLMPVLVYVVCGKRQWSWDCDALDGYMLIITYFQVIGMSANADALTIISWTSVNR